jgi:hypothetical protein
MSKSELIARLTKANEVNELKCAEIRELSQQISDMTETIVLQKEEIETKGEESPL